LEMWKGPGKKFWVKTGVKKNSKTQLTACTECISEFELRKLTGGKKI